MNNTHSLSAKEIKDISRVIVNVVKRNKITKLGEIQDRLLSLGYERKYTHFANLKYVLNEVGINKANNKIIIKIDKKYFRETEVDNLIGDYSKAKRLLKWKPKFTFDKLVDDMLKNED